jgi:hypothetical protein
MIGETRMAMRVLRHRYRDSNPGAPESANRISKRETAFPTRFRHFSTRFSFRLAVVPDYSTALKLETAIKSGELAAGTPSLNPQRPSRRRQ